METTSGGETVPKPAFFLRGALTGGVASVLVTWWLVAGLRWTLWLDGLGVVILVAAVVAGAGVLLDWRTRSRTLFGAGVTAGAVLCPVAILLPLTAWGILLGF